MRKIETIRILIAGLSLAAVSNCLAQDNLEGDTGTLQRTFTGPQGQTREYQQTWDGDNRSITRSFVGPNGQSRTYEQTVTGDSTRVEQTFVGPNGQTHTMIRTTTPEGTDVQKSFSGPTTPADRKQPGASESVSSGLQRHRSGFTVGSRSFGWGRQDRRDSRPQQTQSPGQRNRQDHAQVHEPRTANAQRGHRN